MALVLADRVKETSATEGTITYSLAGAVVGFQTFVAGIGTLNTTYYAATDNTSWEVGIGTVTDAAPDTLARTTILASSNAGAAVSWLAGTKTIVCTLPGKLKFVWDDATENLTLGASNGTADIITPTGTASGHDGCTLGITTGDGAGTGAAAAGGDLNITLGSGGAGGGNGGSAQINAGNGDNGGNGGSVTLAVGLGNGAGTNGNLILQNLPTADPVIAGAVWNSVGTLKISAG